MVNFEHVIAGWEGVKGVSTVHLTFSVVDTLFLFGNLLTPVE